MQRSVNDLSSVTLNPGTPIAQNLSLFLFSSSIILCLAIDKSSVAAPSVIIKIHGLKQGVPML